MGILGFLVTSPIHDGVLGTLRRSWSGWRGTLELDPDRQRRSGLGIEAQHTAVHRFAEAENLKIVSEYVETETGKGADALDRRPQLAAALAAARVAKCPVVVAKLDRLSRDVAFVAGLMAQP